MFEVGFFVCTLPCGMCSIAPLLDTAVGHAFPTAHTAQLQIPVARGQVYPRQTVCLIWFWRVPFLKPRSDWNLSTWTLGSYNSWQSLRCPYLGAQECHCKDVFCQSALDKCGACPRSAKAYTTHKAVPGSYKRVCQTNSDDMSSESRLRGSCLNYAVCWSTRPGAQCSCQAVP